jgi:Fic family protein
VNVDVREYVRESNAIEGVESDQAVEESLDAWEYLGTIDHLTHDAIRETHRLILRTRQPDVAGEYRDGQNHVGGRAPPPAPVVRPLLGWLLQQHPRDGVEAIRWHVEFERIHPFWDGNGRVGRLLYLWHCRQLDLDPVLWRAADREGYYSLFDRVTDRESTLGVEYQPVDEQSGGPTD